MRPIRLLNICLVAAAALASPTAGAMDIATYDAQRKTPPNSVTQVRLRVYLLGVGEGLKLANAEFVGRNEPAMFCLPQTAPLFAEDYIKLIDATLKDSRGTFERQQMPVESILLLALRQTHACPTRSAQRGEPAGSESARSVSVDPVQLAAPAAASAAASVPTR